MFCAKRFSFHPSRQSFVGVFFVCLFVFRCCFVIGACSRWTSSCLNCHHSKLERQIKHFLCVRLKKKNWWQKKTAIKKPIEQTRLQSLLLWPKMSIITYCEVCAFIFISETYIDLDIKAMYLEMCCSVSSSCARTISKATRFIRSEWRHNVSASCVHHHTYTPSRNETQSCYKMRARKRFILSDRFTFSASVDINLN